MSAENKPEVSFGDVLKEYPVPGYALDIKDLLARWKNLAPASDSFVSFKAIWKEMQFHYIHAHVPDNLTTEVWFRIISESGFGYFFVKDYRVRLGAFYFLYLLWGSQREPMQPLRISVEMWNKMLRFLSTECVERQNKEAAAIFRRMKDANAFDLVAVSRVVLPPSIIAGTSSMKKDVRSWEPSPQLGNVLSKQVNVPEIQDTWNNFVSARQRLSDVEGFVSDSTTVSQHEMAELFGHAASINRISVQGLPAHHANQNSEMDSMDAGHFVAEASAGNAEAVAGLEHGAPVVYAPAAHEGGGEMVVEDDMIVPTHDMDY